MKYRFFALFGLTKTRIGLFIALTVLAGIFEGFGMAMFLPVLEFVEKGQDVIQFTIEV